MNEAALIVGMALLTFSLRYALLGMSGRILLSPKLRNALRYVPPSVLSAIVVPTVVMPVDDTVLNARLMGAIAAIVVGYRTKNLLLTILAGMLVFFLWQWLVR
ncbi:AzlD domain-containing protein [Leptolyngbya sp. NIES-2104]|uniref:AzlD domain-containing protein n=1 Tax=Leptolyngbya sp. NIES-2104 TaxID=1552121 RepID=UPI0006ECA01A|nr:AzlD domain-containing protein [Leptolyngbya sp. NIES-2104]GAQ00029.1 hypothetical protein NIES2104_65940 [Leptolyngbya sp. NIES-2104]